MAKVEAACRAKSIPLGGVGLAEAQAQAHFARGYRAIAGFDQLWLTAKAAETQSWCSG